MIKKLFLLLIFSASICSAQDTLLLLSGKNKLAFVDTMDYDFVYYHKVKKDGSEGRRKKKNLDHVFSINKSDTCIYVYEKDSLYDNYWSVNEMKHYLEGRRQARKHYKPYKTLLIGAGVGTGVALYSLFPIKYGEKERELYIRDTVTNSLVTVRFTDQQALSIPIPYWEIIPIGVYVYYVGAAKNTKNFKADDQTQFKKAMFMIGYKETVVNRKVYSAVGASVGSFLTTMLSYMIFDPVEN